MSYTQYAGYGGNPYENSGDMERGQGAQGAQEYGQPPIEHEMSNFSEASHYSNSAAPAVPGNSAVLDQETFLRRVQETRNQIAALSTSIEKITALHSRALTSPDSFSAQLEGLVASTQNMNSDIKKSIQTLQYDAAKSNDNIKTKQANLLKSDFEKKLHSFQDEELRYEREYRSQIARQYKLVYPNASEQEATEASSLDWGNEGVFQTALKSNRSSEATSALGTVRARHNELQRIEKTLGELAAMFADLAQIVEAQEPVVQRTEDNAIQTAEDVKRGNVEIDKANEHARRRNRLKWWCLLVVVLIIIAVALGVGLGVGLAAKTTK